MTGETAGIHDCRILVVEDAEPIRRLIGALLAAAGISRVVFAEDGVAALDRLEEFEPHLLVLDMMMPRMDGFELCRRLRADPRWQRLPILVQTALGSPDERTEIFRAGATDVISKPIHGPEFLARTRVHLENRLLIASLLDFQQRLNQDLQLARRMQEDLLPSAALVEELAAGHGLVIQSHFQPSSEIGGDFWGIEDLGRGRVGVFTADLTGHGVSAALNAFRLHTLMRQLAPGAGEPAAHLTALNRHLGGLLPTGQFATLFYGVIDTIADVLTFSSAGAPDPVLVLEEGATFEDGSGLPIGITGEAAYESRRVAFPPGASLLLYSDALLESADESGACLGSNDILALVDQNRFQQAPLAALAAAFRRARPRLADDLTLVWISRSA